MTVIFDKKIKYVTIFNLMVKFALIARVLCRISGKFSYAYCTFVQWYHKVVTAI